MTNITLQNQLINNPLVYRNILTLPANVRVGLELELESIDLEKVYTLVKKQIGTH